MSTSIGRWRSSTGPPRTGWAVLLAPNYLGFDGGPEGWWETLNATTNTREVCGDLRPLSGGTVS